MLTVHHLSLSQSERIVWLMEELELEYALERYERDPVTRLAPPQYKTLHAFGTAPVLEDGALLLAESGAIIEYVIHIHGHGRLMVAPGAPNYSDYLFWWHFANASMLPAAMTDAMARRLGSSTDPITQSLRARIDRAYAMVEARLGQAPYFAGDALTAADIVMLFPLTTMRSFSPRDISSHRNLIAYLHRIGDRPAYQRAMAKSDPGIAPLLD